MPPETLQSQIANRARFRCEYCQFPDNQSVTRYHQIDHVISRKHGGESEFENLCYACLFCNQHKGSDIASITDGGELVRLFDPRKQSWSDHFSFEGAHLSGKTPEGRVTVKILQMNAPARIRERTLLLESGLLLIDRDIESLPLQ